jgi:hypothetical protein
MQRATNNDNADRKCRGQTPSPRRKRFHAVSGDKLVGAKQSQKSSLVLPVTQTTPLSTPFNSGNGKAQAERKPQAFDCHSPNGLAHTVFPMQIA